MIGKVYEPRERRGERSRRAGPPLASSHARTYIWMCRLTVVDHSPNHLGENRKNSLTRSFATSPEDKDDDRQAAEEGLWPELDSRLQEITVVDPACGSGSFSSG